MGVLVSQLMVRLRSHKSRDPQNPFVTLLVVVERVASVGCDAFGDKYAALRGAMPDRLDRLVGWRILPGLRFLHAVKGDHYEALWRIALDRRGLAAANEIVTIEGRQCFRDLRPILLKCSGIRYINFRDDVARRHLHLPSVNYRGARNADRDADQDC